MLVQFDDADQVEQTLIQAGFRLEKHYSPPTWVHPDGRSSIVYEIKYPAGEITYQATINPPRKI